MSSPDPESVAAARERIALLQSRTTELSAPDQHVRLIGVSKTHGPERIAELHAAGLRDFGENRQNEARDKFPLVTPLLPADAPPPCYHHIGPLQSGSARQIAPLFDWVHGVSDPGARGDALDTLLKSAARRRPELAGSGRGPLHYLFQIDLTGEASKAGGLAPEVVRGLDRFPENEHARFAGFMTMGPGSQDPGETREVFERLRELRDELAPKSELSKGMSGDWELAVQAGATMIRIGTARFGPRGPGPWRP
mgnify:CR=1 FL=1